MGIVTVAEFKKYASKRDDDATGESLYLAYIEAAQSVVEDYLGYSPEETDYSHSFFGDGASYLALKARPVVLASITVDGEAKDIADFITEGEVITNVDNEAFGIGSIVVVNYTGGWSPIPGIIKITTLEIAALFAMEAGENIGVTGTTFDGGNTRTFINYTNFGKYLQKIGKYRIMRLPRMKP